MTNDQKPSSFAAWRAAHLIERLARIARAGSYEAGLNPAQWEALRYLSRANRFSKTPAALADFFQTSRGTVSQTLIALEEKGLVARTKSERDARVVDLDLTDEGRRMLAGDAERALAGDIEASGEAAAVAAGLEGALRHALARRGGKAFGVCKTCRHFERGERNHRCMLLDETLTPQDALSICADMEAA